MDDAQGEVDHAFELDMDLHRGTQLLDGDAAERVQQAREALLECVGMMTSEVPDAPSLDHVEHVWKLCKAAVAFRNCVRAEFIKADPDLDFPDDLKLKEETVH